MVPLSELLTHALKEAGVPVLAVSVGRPTDRSTWRIDYPESASKDERVAGDALLATFDGAAPAVQDALIEREAERLTDQISIRAFWVYWFIETHGREPDEKDRTDAVTKLAAVFKREVARTP